MQYTEKFTGKAEMYDKFRPEYPKALYDYLYEGCGLTANSAIADIGAGTGRFSHPFLKRGSTVYAVEPNTDMRRKAEASFAGFANHRSVNAPAEHTGLTDGSIDLVAAAQAFHWFDQAAFQTECRRILRPNGLVLLVWNTAQATDVRLIALSAIKAKFCPLFSGQSGGMTAQADSTLKTFFLNGVYQSFAFDNPLFHTCDSFIGANLSSSYALNPDDAGYDDYLSALRGLFDTYSQSGVLEMPNVANAYIGKV